MDIGPFNFFMEHIPGKKNLMADALSRAPKTQPGKWISGPTTLDKDAEFCRRVFIRQVKTTDHD